jgi:predicted TIM-barrel fold metal-dependent hydrolase
MSQPVNRHRRERAAMGRIIDSEAHAWTRAPFNWRHQTVPGEKRSKLNPRNAANYKPSRPAPDGSFAPPEDTSDDLLAVMDRHGIDISVIYPGACMCPNAEIARVVARAPDRLIGFGKFGQHVPPWTTPRTAQAATDELEHGLRDLGLRGVAEVSLAHWEPEPPEAAVKALYPWFELCTQYRAPVMVHAHAGGGVTGLAYCDPATFRPLAADFPGVVLILNHMGGSRRDFFDAALALARDHANVCFNTSQTTPAHLTEAVAKVGAERIVFGVDWYALEQPETEQWSQHKNQLGIVRQATMTDRERELVLGESMAALLRLG